MRPLTVPRFNLTLNMVEPRKGIAAALLLALLVCTAQAHASDVQVSSTGMQVSDEVTTGAKPPRLRVTLSGTTALTALVDASKTWGWSFGGSVGLTKAGKGIGGLLQVGYLSPSAHWDHAIPIDFGGQYRWGDWRRSFSLTGGMSFIACAPREGMTPKSTIKLTDGWQIIPLVYLDAGGRVMVAPRFGFDFKLEVRSYWAINILALKISLVF